MKDQQHIYMILLHLHEATIKTYLLPSVYTQMIFVTTYDRDRILDTHILID